MMIDHPAANDVQLPRNERCSNTPQRILTDQITPQRMIFRAIHTEGRILLYVFGKFFDEIFVLKTKLFQALLTDNLDQFLMWRRVSEGGKSPTCPTVTLTVPRRPHGSLCICKQALYLLKMVLDQQPMALRVQASVLSHRR